jgi:hypothetical protein
MRTVIPQGEAGYGGEPDSQGPRQDGVSRHAALPERLQHVVRGAKKPTTGRACRRIRPFASLDPVCDDGLSIPGQLPEKRE